MFEIIFTDSFRKRMKKFAKRHPEILGQYEKTLLLLEQNPYHPSLRHHKLEGRFEGLCSVSINISYRLTMELIIQDKKIIPFHIGSHDEVYR